MRLKALIAASGLVMICGSALAAKPASSLCARTEKVVFSCASGGKLISLCASKNASKTAGYLQYRYGVSKRVELTFPAAQVPPSGRFRLSNTAYSGGGETHLSFRNGGYDYVVYDRTIRTRFDGKGNDPAFSAGLVILKGRTLASHKRCLDGPNSEIGSLAYDILDREEFTDLPIR